jgi:hypothetical protein
LAALHTAFAGLYGPALRNFSISGMERSARLS